ncbi:hypothetical protein GCM10023159_10330 [Brevibacterium yomogidense]
MVGAAIEALEADRTVWAAQIQEMGALVVRGQQAGQVDWNAQAGRAFQGALDAWVRDAHDLIGLADDVVVAIIAHVEALREAADALTAAESALGDPWTGPFPGLPNPVPFGGGL